MDLRSKEAFVSLGAFFGLADQVGGLIGDALPCLLLCTGLLGMAACLPATQRSVLRHCQSPGFNWLLSSLYCTQLLLQRLEGCVCLATNGFYDV